MIGTPLFEYILHYSDNMRGTDIHLGQVKLVEYKAQEESGTPKDLLVRAASKRAIMIRPGSISVED